MIQGEVKQNTMQTRQVTTNIKQEITQTADSQGGKTQRNQTDMWTQPERQGSQKGTHNQGTKLQTNSKVQGKPTTSHKSTKLKTLAWSYHSSLWTVYNLCAPDQMPLSMNFRSPKGRSIHLSHEDSARPRLDHSLLLGLPCREQSSAELKRYNTTQSSSDSQLVTLHNDRLIVIFQLLLEINQLQVKSKSKTRKKKKEMEEQQKQQMNVR